MNGMNISIKYCQKLSENNLKHFEHGKAALVFFYVPKVLTSRKSDINYFTSQLKTRDSKDSARAWFFTREYTQCTAAYTFCFVVVVVGVVVVGATFSQTWQYFSQQLMKHDWTWSEMIRNLNRQDQTW
jgi:hypothetical protein